MLCTVGLSKSALRGSCISTAGMRYLLTDFDIFEIYDFHSTLFTFIYFLCYDQKIQLLHYNLLNLGHMPVIHSFSELKTNLFLFPVLCQISLKINRGFLKHIFLKKIIRLYSRNVNETCLHLLLVLYLSVIISIHSFTIFHLQRRLLNEAFPLIPSPEVTQQQQKGDKHTVCLLNNPGRICCWLHKCC